MGGMAVPWQCHKGGTVVALWQYLEGGTVGVGTAAVPSGGGTHVAVPWEQYRGGTVAALWGGGTMAVPWGRPFRHCGAAVP